MDVPFIERTRKRLAIHHGRRIGKIVALLGILVFVFFVARIPHAPWTGGTGYPLPLHMDEYLQWGKAAAVARQGTTDYASPWFGGEANPTGRFYHQVGFHVLLAVVHQVSGIDWVTIFTYGPGVVLALTALGAYTIGEPHGFGHEAALFTALIPTSVRFLGPAFLLPITFAFPFVLGVVSTSFQAEHRRAIGAIVPIVVATWFVHARAAGFLAVPVLVAAAAKARDRPKLAAAIAAAVLIPLLFGLQQFLDAASSVAVLEERLPIDRAFFDLFGIGTLGLYVIGSGFAIADLRDRVWVPLALFASSLAAFAFIFARGQFRINPLTMYSRAHMLFFLVAAPVAGYGLSRIVRAGLRARSRSRSLPTARVAALLIALLAVTPAVAKHHDEKYYHIIDQEDHETFRWMDENLDDKYDNALMLPWQGLAYSAQTGRSTASVQFPGDRVSDNDIAIRFFRGGGQDTQILRRNQIGVVYAPFPIDNPDLKQVHDNVYVLQPPRS